MAPAFPAPGGPGRKLIGVRVDPRAPELQRKEREKVMSDILLVSTALAVIATGLVGGVFLTFSDFVMRALAAGTASGSIEAMQEINRKVYGSLFLVLLMGTTVLAVLLVGHALFFAPADVARWLLAGGVIHLGGVFLITVVCNVPMNKRLDAFQPDAPEAARYWQTYVSVWTRWNYLCTVASGGAALCFLMACLARVQA